MRAHAAISRRAHRAFSLVEALAVIALLGIMAAGTLPIVQGVATNAAASDRVRRATEGNTFAMDRIARLLRDVPAGAAPSTIALTAASSSAIVLADGRGVERQGTDLILRDASGDRDVLVRGVTEFEIVYLRADGVTSAIANPELTQRFVVRCVVDGLELRTVVLPRARMIQ